MRRNDAVEGGSEEEEGGVRGCSDEALSYHRPVPVLADQPAPLTGPPWLSRVERDRSVRPVAADRLAGTSSTVV